MLGLWLGVLWSGGAGVLGGYPGPLPKNNGWLLRCNGRVWRWSCWCPTEAPSIEPITADLSTEPIIVYFTLVRPASTTRPASTDPTLTILTSTIEPIPIRPKSSFTTADPTKEVRNWNFVFISLSLNLWLFKFCNFLSDIVRETSWMKWNEIFFFMLGLVYLSVITSCRMSSCHRGIDAHQMPSQGYQSRRPRLRHMSQSRRPRPRLSGHMSQSRWPRLRPWIRRPLVRRKGCNKCEKH